jgi:hypothetical protein
MPIEIEGEDMFAVEILADLTIFKEERLILEATFKVIEGSGKMKLVLGDEPTEHGAIGLGPKDVVALSVPSQWQGGRAEIRNPGLKYLKFYFTSDPGVVLIVHDCKANVAIPTAGEPKKRPPMSFSDFLTVKCCKCFRNTRQFECSKCGHRTCTSCKPVKRRSPKKAGSRRLEK